MKSLPNKIKEKAVVLRKKGLSYGEISKKLELPKSTLGVWLKDIKLNKTLKEKILQKQVRHSTSVPSKQKKQKKKKLRK